MCVAACSQSQSAPRSSPSPTAGISPEGDGGPKALNELCLVEQKKLCDWTAAQGGGYGSKIVCEAGAVAEYADQATCLASFPAACSTATVADWEACRIAEAKEPCSTLQASPDECAPLSGCIGQTDASLYGGTPACSADGGDDGSTE